MKNLTSLTVLIRLYDDPW